MQLALSAGTLLLLCLSSASVNAIVVREFENFQDFDYCGEIVNPFTGTSQCVCINQLNEALVHTRFEGLEPLFDRTVREGPACTPPSSSSDFDFSPLTTDSSTSPTTPLATATSSDNVEGVGNDLEFDPLDRLNETPSEISDTSDGRDGDELDDADTYGWLDFSLSVLRDE